MQIIVFVVLQLLFGGLHERARQLPDVDQVNLEPFLFVVHQEATHRVPAALLISLAWAESRFESSAQPACGVMQVFPEHIRRPQSDCALWRRDVRAAIRAGVIEIEMMLLDKRVRGDMYRALMYRACGNAFFQGTCSKAKEQWVAAAIARWRWLNQKGIGT